MSVLGGEGTSIDGGRVRREVAVRTARLIRQKHGGFLGARSTNSTSRAMSDMLHPCCMEPPGRHGNCRKTAEMHGIWMQHEIGVASGMALHYVTEFA